METLNGLGLFGVTNVVSTSKRGEERGLGEALGVSHGVTNSSDGADGDPMDLGGSVIMPEERADGGRLLDREGLEGEGLDGSESGYSMLFIVA